VGAAAYLRKPVRRGELLAAMETAFSEAAGGTRGQLITRHSIQEKWRGLTVLLAEDNAVNQQLAVKLLEKAGHKVVLAGHGREAVDKHATERCDVVLMDVQMPGMDGLEATALIRERERTTGTRIPIIAMTANALKGDRERCLEAGMDDYLTKPIRRDALFDALHRWSLAASLTAPLAEATPPPDPGLPAFSAQDALERVGGDRGLLREIAQLLLQDAPPRVEALHAAQSAGDLAATLRLAHALKGAVANLGGLSMAEALQKVEQAAASEPGALAERTARAVGAWQALEPQLRKWVEEHEKDPGR
jgi:two-component system sensor histidine kinase/response regulator